MSVTDLLAMAQEALRQGTVMLIVPLGIVLVVSVVVSLVQAVLQLQDMTLTFVPKVLVVVLVLWVLGPWLFGLLTDFTTRFWLHAAGLTG